MTDRNGNSLRPGDRVTFQVHPQLAWHTGTVSEDGYHVVDDRDGSTSLPWPSCTQRVEAAA